MFVGLIFSGQFRKVIIRYKRTGYNTRVDPEAMSLWPLRAYSA